MLLRLSIEGLVKVDGTVKPLHFLRGAPYGIDGSSIRTMAQWKCTPATLAGIPVTLSVSFELTFRLN